MFNHQLHLTWPFRQTLEKLLKYTYYQMKFLLGNVGFCCCCICYVKYNKKGYQGRFTFEVFLFVEKADKLRVLYFGHFLKFKMPHGKFKMPHGCYQNVRRKIERNGKRKIIMYIIFNK